MFDPLYMGSEGFLYLRLYKFGPNKPEIEILKKAFNFYVFGLIQPKRGPKFDRLTKSRMLNIKIYNTNVHIAVRNEVWIKFRGHSIVKISNSGSFGPNLYRRKYRKPSDPMYRGSNMQQDGNF